jgi:hypothetical protein
MFPRTLITLTVAVVLSLSNIGFATEADAQGGYYTPEYVPPQQTITQVVQPTVVPRPEQANTITVTEVVTEIATPGTTVINGANQLDLSESGLLGILAMGAAYFGHDLL